MNKRTIASLAITLIIGILIGHFYIPEKYRGKNETVINTCVYDGFTGNQCSGCQLESQNDLCLMNGPEGSITASFGPGLNATLKAVGKNGTIVQTGIPYGVDKVFKDISTGGYQVVAANRENNGQKSFDQVLLVKFSDEKPSISTIINQTGFGDHKDLTWHIIPLVKNYRDLALEEIDSSGNTVKKFIFGPQLIARTDFDANTSITKIAIYDQDSVVVSFSDNPLGNIRAQYVINPNESTIKKLILK